MTQMAADRDFQVLFDLFIRVHLRHLRIFFSVTLAGINSYWLSRS